MKLYLAFTFATAIGVSAFAQQTPQSIADAELPSLITIYKDLHALPVHEGTGVPYASTVTTKNDLGQEVSVMHACGHDIHMSTFIGTARALAKLKDKWHGTLIMIGQPAEEAVGGARALLKDGLYTRWPKPAYVIGLHDDAEIA